MVIVITYYLNIFYSADVDTRSIPNQADIEARLANLKGSQLYMYKAVLDGSVSNIRSLINLVILQSLGDTTFLKRAVQTDTQTICSKFHHST